MSVFFGEIYKYFKHDPLCEAFSQGSLLIEIVKKTDLDIFLHIMQ